MVNYTSGLSGTYYLEYGLTGFTPGTGSSPGTGGTVFSNVNSNGMTLLGFSNSAIPYDIYARVQCSGGAWSPNSPVYSFTTSGTPLRPEQYPDPIDINSSNVFIPLNSFTQVSLQNTCSSGWPTGEEKRIRFDSPDDGTFELRVIINVNVSQPPNVGFKILNDVSLPGSYTCLNASGTIINYPFYTFIYGLGPLARDVAYDIIFDSADTSLAELEISVVCPSPQSITKSNITPTSVDINWSCNCLDSMILEYGLPGFVPGTGLTPGANGTILFANNSPYTISGLTPFTDYDLYLRSKCGTFFTSNKKYKFKSAKDCSLFPQLNCGDFSLYNYAGSIAKRGAWDLGGVDSSEEKVFTFTPAQTGNYSLFFYNMSAGSTGYIYNMRAYYKPDSVGCNEQGWTLFGTFSQNPLSFTPVTYSFGPLTAGVTYYIALDSYSYTFIHSYNCYFQLQCTGTCYSPILSNPGSITPTTATINGACNTCGSGGGILEFGPAGFIPGTGQSTGTGGTIILNATFPYVLNNLSSDTTYDVYARSDCSGAGLGFSTNAGPKTFRPCSSPPTGISTSTGGSSITCPGDSITLYRNGGVLATGCDFYWYKTSCGYTPVGTGDSVTISPSSSSYYYVRAEGTCGVSTCVNKNISSPGAPVSISGADSICKFTTTSLSASNGWLSYLWSTGETTQSITANPNALYTLSATNALGCNSTATKMVYNLPLPAASITAGGPVTFCAANNVTLYANTGSGLSYQWKKYANLISGATSPTYFVSKAGKYKCIVTNQSGCSRSSNSITITVNPLPPASITASGPTTFCTGDSVILTANSGAGFTYEWKKYSNFLSGANASSYSVKVPGKYKCIVTNANGCSKGSNSITITIPCRVAVDSAMESFRIYPNPSTGDFYLETQCDILSGLTIRDLAGKEVHSVVDAETETRYRISGLASGTYFIYAECNGMVYTARMVRIDP